MKEKYYNVNQIYTGILNISTNFNNLVYDNNYLNFQNKKWELVNNGALDLTYEFDDFTKRRTYNSVFTMFIKENDKYLCLHNNKLYDLEGNDYISELKPLKESLPQVDFNIEEEISLNKLYNLFTSVFDDLKCIKLYNKSKHLFSDFYVGVLNLVDHININNNSVKKNIIENKLLLHDDYVGGYNQDINNIEYNYDIVECLFLKIDNKYYCLNNFKFYDTEDIAGENFCQNLISLKEFIEDDNTYINLDEVTIKNANNLYCGQKELKNNKIREISSKRKFRRRIKNFMNLSN